MNNSPRIIIVNLTLACVVIFLFGCAGKKTSSVSPATTVGITADTSRSDKGLLELNNSYEPDPNEKVLVDERPMPLNTPRLEYPETARKANIEGSVWVKVLIGRDGKVWAAEVAQPSGKNVGFEASAIEAAKRGTWKPAMQTGQPIALWVTYEVKFQLGN